MPEQQPGAISVSFTYTRAEFVRVQYWLMLRQVSLWLIVVGFGVLAATEGGPGIAGFVVAVGLLAIIPWWYWSAKPRMRAEHQYVFSSSAIRYHALWISMEFDWSMTRHLIEGRTSFAIRLKEPGGVAVLKRAFADEAAREEFRALCAAHIPVPENGQDDTNHDD